MKIVVGTSDLDAGGSTYDVESIEIFEGFNITSRAHDIAVIKSSKNFIPNDIEILDLYSEELQEGDLVTLTGFGALEVCTYLFFKPCKINIYNKRMSTYLPST